MKKSSSINRQLFVLTVVPLLIITLLLGFYFIKVQLTTANAALNERGKTLTSLFASSVEFGLLTGNKMMMQKLTLLPGGEEDVADIIILDSDFNVVTRYNKAGPEIKIGKALLNNKSLDFVYFLHPVISSDNLIDDSPELNLEHSRPEIIGWVQVILSTKPTQQLKNDLIFKGTVIAIVGLLITFIFVRNASRRITRPISALTDTIERIRDGELGLRATSASSSISELQTLARGINLLTQRVEITNRGLENRIELATSKLSRSNSALRKKHNALQEEKKRADEANAAKDAFLAQMSHEIRTPMTSVVGYLSLLEDSPLNAKQISYTHAINTNARMLRAIIDDILDFSKLNAHQYHLEFESVNPINVLNDCIEMQACRAMDKGLFLLPIYDCALPKTITTDPTRLMQVFTNIIGNAIKFTDQGHVTIRAQMAKNANNHTCLAINVHDSGTGIAPEQLTHIFEPFAQADNTITRRYGGTGLGLAISKQFLELMSGEIAINSDGASFTEVSIYLPISEQEYKNTVIEPNHIGLCTLFDFCADDRESVEQSIRNQGYTPIIETLSERMMNNTQCDIALLSLPPKASELPDYLDTLANFKNVQAKHHMVLGYEQSPKLDLQLTYFIKPLTNKSWLDTHQDNSPTSQINALEEELKGLLKCRHILVADDNHFNRQLLSELLGRYDCQLDVACNGLEAIEKTLTNRYDLVLMDVHMPEVDGITATKEILANQTVPVVGLTADVISTEHKLMLEAGASDVLTKPLDYLQLLATLRRLFSTDKPRNHSDNIKTPSAADLVNPVLLTAELERLLEALLKSYETRSKSAMRNYSHQLLGVAGLYEIAELEMAAHELHETIAHSGLKEIWGCLWRVQRIIRHDATTNHEVN